MIKPAGFCVFVSLWSLSFMTSSVFCFLPGLKVTSPPSASSPRIDAGPAKVLGR